ncbi:hypothetical protein HGG76_18125 [Ochrobactrum tritici]|uniref:DUF2160 domain-containing protein n=1 Tax=Brucella tritici TaxID=94626 RepID=A0A7X6FRG3_9HYPH|nr:hypothetical protein [Brucella tritici]
MIHMPDFSWMAWTWQTAAFSAVSPPCSLAWVYGNMLPWRSTRNGILGFETTRGDRLFISLLGSAFINLAWLGLVGPNLWWAVALSVVYAIGVFRFV